MEKPTLKDFNLTEQDFVILEEQKKKYENALADHAKYKKRVEDENSSTFKIAFIPPLIAFLAIGLSTAVGCIEQSKCGVYYGIYFAIAIVYIIFIIKCGYTNTDNLPSPKEINYIDQNLTDRISQYNSATRNYKLAVEREKAERELAKNRQHELFWKNMDGYEFENAVAKLYEQIGYRSFVTPKSGDGGVDIILKKGNKKYAVQCKHHKKSISPNDYRALIGSIVAGQYDGGIFVSLSGFTTGVINENKYSRVRIELVSLKDLVQLSKEIAVRNYPTNEKRSTNTTNIKTPAPKTTNNVTIITIAPPKKTNDTPPAKPPAKNLIGAIAQIEVNGIGTKNGEIIKITDGMEGKIATIKINVNGKSEYRNYMLSAIKDRIIKYGSTGNL